MAALDSLAEVRSGAFARSPSTFLSSPLLPLPPGRYALYVSLACPWACRILALLALRGLRADLDVIICCLTWEPTLPAQDAHRGWVFRARAKAGSVDAALAEVPLVDPHFGQDTIRGIYALLCAEAGIPPPQKFTVPLLVDLEERRIVCNESSVLLRDLAGAGTGSFELRPAALRGEVEALNESMYEAFNNGVYRCGFATTQEAYNAAARDVSAFLDGLVERLSDGREFLCGDCFTEADIRCYVTLVRYDPVYVVHFKCAFRSVRASPLLLRYMRRCHGLLGRGEPEGSHPVTNLLHIKQHYFGSHPTLNPYGIVPAPALGEGTELV